MSSIVDKVGGPAFPFRIDPATGRVATAEGMDKVRQNIRVLLATRRGERPLEREFGTRLPALVHEPDDELLGDLVREEVASALVRWEPRVLGVDARLVRDGTGGPSADGEVHVVVSYRHTLEPVAGQTTVPLA
jgi:phage baseplate assembly protein W